MPPETRTKVDGFQLVAPPLAPDQDSVSLHHAAGVGSIIDTFRPVRFLTWRRKWNAAITEFECGTHHFADVQREGSVPRVVQHRHEFMPEHRNGCDGTLVRDVIEYEVGFGPLGALANSLFIDRQMRQIFAHRQKVLFELLSHKSD